MFHGENCMGTKVGVLLIDSNAESMKITKDALEKNGASHVYTARSIDSAKAFLRDNTAIFIVMDRYSQEKDNLDLVKWIRNSFNNSNYQSPIIMFMSNPTAKDVKSARDAGITEFIVKPFSRDVLRKVVFSVLESPRN